jgi:3-isopropylmalate/(R)-2-methylmalate dehydratase small subunit
MQAFTTLQSSLLPLDRSNVDTDAIIPKQYLKSIKKSGFGQNLFDDWRYIEPGEPDQDSSHRAINKEFVLNDARYKDAEILLAKDNFGCGSSREHAVWALLDYGFKAVISNSFADIFFSNCYKNGLLPIVLDTPVIESLFTSCLQNPQYSIAIDLPAQEVRDDSGLLATFEIDEFRKHCLLNGLDEIALTLQHADKIRAYEKQLAETSPWLFSHD